MKRHLVVLSGAGISAESGLKTFRSSGGLWEGYNVQDVATPEAWERDPQLVLRFYNERRKAMRAAQPNAAHRALAELEQHFFVSIITQNVDDLHERAGSTTVCHLHGELKKAQSCADKRLVYDVPGDELNPGQLCELGSQLRPQIVWFGEEVPMMDRAIEIVQKADLFMVIGTSLVVYPAAGLVDYVPRTAPKFLIDPNVPAHVAGHGFTVIAKNATQGVPECLNLLKIHSKTAASEKSPARGQNQPESR